MSKEFEKPVVGRIWSLKGAHVLLSGTKEYAMLYFRGKLM
jgi:hypothetical protein